MHLKMSATKFFEHFVFICRVIEQPLLVELKWNEEDGFYYDVLHLPAGADPFR